MAAKNMEDIAAFIKEMRFRKKLFGGVDEADVWRQIEKLQKEYQSAYEALQERNSALLQERENEIRSLKTLSSGETVQKPQARMPVRRPVQPGTGRARPAVKPAYRPGSLQGGVYGER